MIFGYIRKTITNDSPPRVGVAAIKRIPLGVGGWIGLLFAFASIDLAIRLAIEFLK